MDTKWRKYSHSLTTKIIVFIIAILCFTGAITVFLNTVVFHNGNFGAAFEKSYYQSKDFEADYIQIVDSLKTTEKYQSEEHILTGKTITEGEISDRENQLFQEFQVNSKNYNPNLSETENYNIFRQVYAGEISQIRNQLIIEDLNEYRAALRTLKEYQGLIYYAKSGENQITNSPNQTKNYFKSFPAYMILDGSEQDVFPGEIKNNNNHYWDAANTDNMGLSGVIYTAFTDKFLDSRISEWQENKNLVTNNLYEIAGFLLALALAFIFLVLVSGRKPEDQKIHLNSIDRIYNDVNLVMCFLLIAAWFGAMTLMYDSKIYELIFPVTLLIAVPGLLLVLSLVKHIKNRTLFKHTLTYSILYKLYEFIRDVYNTGSVAVKVVLIVIGYPLIAGLTFFMFPITLGVAAWLALKKVKEFNAIKEGIRQVKDGDIHFTIDVPGDGEFAQLASDINTITDGLNKAVESEIKSERLKSELITNVSHDIRTPLTSIITYVDLLKNETDETRIQEYIDIIDQKSQRLKILTDDLFEATKASSGNIPVNFEKIDLLSLLTQGLGEFDEKIQEHRLDFKINSTAEKIYISADGKLLWRAIENLLLNIFKYALEGSRVYIDIINSDTKAELIIKNISAYELNISSDELMERFVRGDASRSSQGSGLGLSIARSLIEMQKGSFDIEIDGDLFKAIVTMPKRS